MKSILAEWKELFTNKKLLVPVLAVLFIPLLYSGMFLWAFWDPYDQLDQLPVAVVNLDEGAIYEGNTLTIGEDLQENLKKNDGFKWEFVSKDEAYDGLKEQYYYMVIEIPSDFSKHATTLLDDKPSPLEMKFVPNESYNFLSAQIGSTAIEKIKEEVSSELTSTYAEAMFSNVETMAEGYKQAAEGSNSLNSGVHELKDGSETLKKGLEEIADKSIVFQKGVGRVEAGVAGIHHGNEELSKGLAQLVKGQEKLSVGSVYLHNGAKALNEGLKDSDAGVSQLLQVEGELSKGVQGLAEGLSHIAAETTQFKKGGDEAKEQAVKLAEGMGQLKQLLQPIIDEASEEEKAQITAQIAELTNGSNELSQRLSQLEQGAIGLEQGTVMMEQNGKKLAEVQMGFAKGLEDLAKGSEKLTVGSSELVANHQEFNQKFTEFGRGLGEANKGSAKLTEGTNQLVAGIQELNGGASLFQQGTSELAEGSKNIYSGLAEVGKGTETLKEKLEEASEKSGSVNGTEQTYDMFANPVHVKAEVDNGVPNYGTGFAPYFLSLGLFVGALLLSIVFPLRDPAGTPKSGTWWFVGKVAVLAVVGVLQALLADGVLILGLGVEVQNLTFFIFFSILTSFTFIALVQFLVTTLGDPGRFVAIIILILQLTTSAGTFPLELIPNMLQPFNLFLPMTYSVSGFKAIISSGDFSIMRENVNVLIGFMLVMLAGTWSYFMFKYRKLYKN
ncbi:Chromosome partition protein Smc [Bacillus sp. THAF10]|uniref:YhgE/Pip domain-containing protein n=1 Tax=Bacillus sp. THAF10 TaxID=2587848 RepID=UPI001267C3B9|nr:YhgE/Pip domain-containing protein [Bacillus sp. THAF10]QFT88284.1 Chromosome partition protein Smc [Bacillus sp. THAF10]